MLKTVTIVMVFIRCCCLGAFLGKGVPLPLHGCCLGAISTGASHAPVSLVSSGLTSPCVSCLVQPVDVNKLVKGRPLDNMEFMQWFKAYWDSRLGSQHLNYDPVGRRTHAKSGAMKGAGSRPAAGAAAARRPTDSQVRYSHIPVTGLR